MGKNNIILIGMPGAGTSTMGVVLAKIAGMDFLDCDLLIQNRHHKTLQRLIDELGPEGFIELENEALKTIDVEDTIISTGGSACYSDEAMNYLRSIGTVVFLDISFEELRRRLGDLDERGVVMRGGAGMTLRALYDERQPLYEQYADYVADVEGLSITDSARAVLDTLKLN